MSTRVTSGATAQTSGQVQAEALVKPQDVKLEPQRKHRHGHSKSKSAEMQPGEKKQHFGWIMALYLIGLFLGSLTMGVITPVRPIIQNSLGVDAATGIWMINIFTLMYAAVIPISGKLADRHGRKIVFLLSIFIFGVGSLICGLSNSMGSFAMLLVGRVVQGLGAGGIMPIATAEFGTSFPPEKRGMALGMVGGVYGIGSVLGATVGSAIVDIFGATQWQWVFYLNIPVAIFIIIFGLIYIPNHKAEQVFKIDKLGTLLMVVIIISLLYGLKNVDFFNFVESVTQWQAWVFLLISLLLIPLFVFVEKRAEDPIFHIEYMSNRQIVLTLIISMLVGMIMMGMVFIPQFAENALMMSSGAGGYFVIVLGLFAGIVSPVSGVMVDRFGEKGVMLIGLIISAVGSFYLAFVAVAFPNIFNVIVSLIFIGLGMGFTMGTPLNYMMLANTKIEESNAALATLSLVRSIGTAIAPALMVGFIIQAASGLQTDLMNTLPEVDGTPEMAQKAELKTTLAELVAVDDKLQTLISSMDTSSMEEQGVSMDMGSNQSVREKLNEMDIDAMLDTSSSMDMDMDMSSSDKKMPEDLLDKMQNSDVTTIVGITQELVAWVFSDALTDVKADIQSGIQKGADGIGEGVSGIQSGIDGINEGISKMDSAKAEMNSAIDEMNNSIASMNASIYQMKSQQSEMVDQKAQLEQGIAGIEQGLEGAKIGIIALTNNCTEMKQAIKEIEDNPMFTPEQKEDMTRDMKALVQMWEAKIAESEQKIPVMEAQLAEMKAGAEGIQSGIDGVQSGIDGIQSGIDGIQSGIAGIQTGLASISSAQDQMREASSLMGQEKELMQKTQSLMISMKNDIPALFKTAENDYQNKVLSKSDDIQKVYQTTVNQGYRNMYILVGVLSLIALVLLLFYTPVPRGSAVTEEKGHPKIHHREG